MNTSIELTPGEAQYLRALLQAEDGFESESRHLQGATLRETEEIEAHREELLTRLDGAVLEAEGELTPRERDTVLAALRYWQRNVDPQDRGDESEGIACYSGDALDDAEIDSLCERINI